VSTVFVASPVVVATPVVVPPLLIVEQPVVYSPSTEWIASAAPETTAAPMIALSQSTTPAPVAQYGPMPDAGLLEQTAWDALALDQAGRAEESFAGVLNQEPGNARARAGYGVAAALSGRDATAAWAMRDALSLRPDVLDGLPLTSGVRWQITEVARQIEGRVAQSNSAAQSGSGDLLFLAAALRASVGDRAQAAYAMDLAMRAGPVDEVRSNFRSRLESQLAWGGSR